jgi:hypothetical protein
MNLWIKSLNNFWIGYKELYTIPCIFKEKMIKLITENHVQLCLILFSPRKWICDLNPFGTNFNKYQPRLTLKKDEFGDEWLVVCYLFRLLN